MFVNFVLNNAMEKAANIKHKVVILFG